MLNTVKPLLFGDNIEWTNDGMGFWLSKEKKLDEKLVAEVRAAGVTHLRYPGGTLSDYFDWNKAVGDKRQPIPNPFNKGKPEDPRFGPAEFIALCRRLDIPGTITLNAGTGRPEDAAGWVKYFRDQGFPVTAFAVGNEIYMAKPPEPIVKTPEQYIDFYLKCREAIDKVAPGTKLGVIGLHDTGAFSLSRHKDWMEKVLRALGDKISFIDVHNGYAPVARTVLGDPKAKVPTRRRVRRLLSRGVGLRRREPPGDQGRPGQVRPARGQEHRNPRHRVRPPGLSPGHSQGDRGIALEPIAGRSAVSGVPVQRLRQGAEAHQRQPSAAASGRVRGAASACTARSSSGRRTGATSCSTSSRCTRRWPDGKCWPWRSSRRSTRRTPSASCPSSRTCPCLDVGAYRTPDGKKLTLFLINRDVRRSAAVKLDLGRTAWRAESMTTLSADSYKAENGPSQPNKVVPVTTAGQDRTAVELPKHSLLRIDCSKR